MKTWTLEGWKKQIGSRILHDVKEAIDLQQQGHRCSAGLYQETVRKGLWELGILLELEELRAENTQLKFEVEKAEREEKNG